MRKLITAMDFQKLAGTEKQVTISPGYVLSPSAIDMAKQMGIEIIRAESSINKAADDAEPLVQAEQKCTQDNKGESEGTISTHELPGMIRKVLAEVLKPACPNPKVTYIAGDKVTLDPFDQAPSGQKVGMKDVVTSRESNLCAGFMSYDHSQMPWKLTYDEVDYVVDGIFTLKVGDKTYTCRAGDVMYIPKNTSVVFGSPDKTKVFYVTYPANWADLK